MFHRRTYFTAALVLLVCVSGIWAGDTASFVDLGFSQDGKTYMFGQYGVQSGTLKPWAELFVVDVPNNRFVSGGRLSYVYTNPVVSGQDGSGALYHLIAKNAALAEQYRINYCFQRQPLFVALNNTVPAAQVQFRDFVSGAAYSASLVSFVEGSGAALASSFYINLERIAKDGTRKTYTVGSPSIKRSQVVSYRIQKAMIAPYDGSMIFLIEMKIQDGAEFNIRYMIEALRI